MAMWLNHRVDPPGWIVRGIGRVLVEWSDLEWQFEDAIRTLMESDIKRGRIVTTGMNAKTRAKVLWNLTVALKASAVSDRAKKFSDRIDALQPQRDKLAHGLWAKTRGRWYLIRSTGSQDGLARPVLPRREPMTVGKLHKIRRDIREFRQDMDVFRKDCEALVFDSLRPPPPYKSPRHMRQRNL